MWIMWTIFPCDTTSSHSQINVASDIAAVSTCLWRIITRCDERKGNNGRDDDHDVQHHHAKVLLGPGLEHLMPQLVKLIHPISTYRHDSNNNNKSMTTTTTTTPWLPQHDVWRVQCMSSHQPCLICAPCHWAVHRTHDNLAWPSHVILQLLQDDTIYQFRKWVSQQKPGRQAVFSNIRWGNLWIQPQGYDLPISHRNWLMYPGFAAMSIPTTQ